MLSPTNATLPPKKRLLLCFSENITCLHGGLLRICQVFSLSCKTVYRCVMTYCCFMFNVLYTFRHAVLVKETPSVPTSTPRTGIGYVFRTSDSKYHILTYDKQNWLCVFQINHQPHATISPVYYLTFIYSSTCFGHTHAHRQELNNCSSSLRFYLRSVVIAVLLVVVGPFINDPTTTNSTATTTLRR
jgi:hypothetical protein